MTALYMGFSDSLCSYLSTLMTMPSFSILLYWDFWYDDAQPPGDGFGDVSVA